MFLRNTKRKKNGKLHRYFSVVENRRLADGRSTQRQVLYLGEINDSQQAAWRKTLEVFDEDRSEYRNLTLFPDDRCVPLDAADAVSVKLTEMQLRRPRAFGDCWLGCVLWDRLRLTQFWEGRLADPRAGVPWVKVLQLLAVNRLIDPGSEFRVHRQWFVNSAMDELLNVDFSVAAKDRLYRCLDRLLAHKDDLCKYLTERWKTLFDAEFDVLLYDLTSTYFEGLCEQIPKAKHGYSRDGRGDCRQVVIALVVTVDGLPMAYEVLPGNTSDKTTLGDFLTKIETLYGKARRVWVMDRGIPTEDTLRQMRDKNVAYLVGTPRGLLNKLEKELVDKPWAQVREQVKVRLMKKDADTYIAVQSEERRKKENAMRRRRLRDLLRGLYELRRRPPSRDVLLGKVAVLKKAAGRSAGLVKVRIPKPHEEINRDTFIYTLNQKKFRRAMDGDGSYLLRSNIGSETDADAAELWKMYMQLTRIEAAFKSLKSDLGLRPIHHQVGPRVEAHILVAFLGYCLTVTLRKMLEVHAPGLTPTAALETLSAIRMVDVVLPTTDGRMLVMPRYTEPEAEQMMVLEKLQLSLPQQPPPRIRSAEPMEAKPSRGPAVVETY